LGGDLEKGSMGQPIRVDGSWRRRLGRIIGGKKPVQGKKKGDSSENGECKAKMSGPGGGRYQMVERGGKDASGKGLEKHKGFPTERMWPPLRVSRLEGHSQISLRGSARENDGGPTVKTHSTRRCNGL